MPVQTLWEIVRFGAGEYGDQAAFRWKVKKEIAEKSYRELLGDVSALRRAFSRLGLLGGHGAIIGSTSYPWIASYFAITSGGAVAVPIDAQLPADAVCELLNRADVTFLVYDELRADVAAAVKDRCPGVKTLISIQAVEDREGVLSFWELLKNGGGLPEADGEIREPEPDDLCTILFTSGTTGVSKGVMLTHRNLTDNAVCLDMKIPRGTVSMTLLPINHVYCLTMDIIKGLHIGTTICINDSIMHVQRNLKLFQPEIILLVPLIIEGLYGRLKDLDPAIPKDVAAKAAFGGRLRIICSGGAYLDPEYVKRFREFGITILQGYGMTECSPVISTNLESENKIGSVGKLLPNCQAKVVDEELWVKGSSVMQGYYKMPKETAEALEDGWLKTGDLGYVDEDNFVYITGRKKNLIILANGENVSPEELENSLSRSSLVKEILVRERERVIEAEIFPDYEEAEKQGVEDIREALQALIDAMNQDMPVYKRIYRLIVRETEFEKTPSRKIKRF